MAFYNHLSSTMQEGSKRGVSASQRRHARRARRVSDSVQSQEESASGATFHDVIAEVHKQGVQSYFVDSDTLTGTLALSAQIGGVGKGSFGAYGLSLTFRNADSGTNPELVDAHLVSGAPVAVDDVRLELYPRSRNTDEYCVWYRSTDFMDDITIEDVSRFIEAFASVVKASPATYVEAYSSLLSQLKKHSAYYTHGLDKSALSQLEAIAKGERPASVTDSQPASPRYKARSVSRHKVGDSDTPRFKFSISALDTVLQDVNSTFAFTRKSEVPGADLTITYYTSIHLDSDAERECNCHPRLATAISTSQSSPDDIVAIQFKLVTANGTGKDVIMENTITTAAEAGGVLTLSHIKDAIQSFTLHAYTSLDEVKSAFADTFMGDPASMEASQEVSDAADSEKPIAAGDTVYASSPKLETLQGVPLEVVKVREDINMVVVKLPDGKTRSLPLSYVKR